MKRMAKKHRKGSKEKEGEGEREREREGWMEREREGERGRPSSTPQPRLDLGTSTLRRSPAVQFWVG